MKKNYYIALLFEERPDLHMTLKYYKGRDEAWLKRQEEVIDNYCIEEIQGMIDMELTIEKMFGANKDVRVLCPLPGAAYIWPEWVQIFTGRSWSPHVTCDDAQLTLTATHLAIMHKKEVVVSWEL